MEEEDDDMFRSLVTSAAQEMEEEDDNMFRSFFPQVTYVLFANSTCGSKSSDLNITEMVKLAMFSHYSQQRYRYFLF